jgi:hypothetical protein
MTRAAKSDRPTVTFRATVEKPGSLLTRSQGASALSRKVEDRDAKSTKLQSDQTGQNPVSSATVKTVRLTNGEKAYVRRHESEKRREYLKSLETDAQAFVKGFQAAKALNDEANVLHRKFKDMVEQMRPVFERVRYGFAHLKKGETVMGERTGPAWADRYLGVTYDWLCRCLNPPKAGTLLLTDGTKVVTPSDANTERNHTEENPRLPKVKQTLPTMPSALNADSTDNQYIKTCVRFIKLTLRPLESDPQRFHKVALLIAQEILGEPSSPDDGGLVQHSELAAVSE